MACTDAAVITQNFEQDPLLAGWKIFGDVSLFEWNATNHSLEVTWDSSRSNSFYYLPLGTIVSKEDDFMLSFTFLMRELAIGVNPSKPYTFQIALGLMNLADATQTNFYRGAGQQPLGGPRNLVEFDYFADSGFGATFAPTIVSTNNRIYFSDNHPLELTTGNLFRITMQYSASSHLLKTIVSKDGQFLAELRDLAVPGTSDFRVDTVTITSYSDAVQAGDPQYWGSVRARGVVQNISLIIPDPPVSDLRITRMSGSSLVSFTSRRNWLYVLQRSVEFRIWEEVSSVTAGTGDTLILSDPTPHPERDFYRVKAQKP